MSLPLVYAGQRRRIVWRLLLNGLLQAAASFSMAMALRGARASDTTAAWLAVSALLLLALALFVLRVFENRDAQLLGQEYILRVRWRILARVTARPVSTTRGQTQRWGVAMTRLITDLNSLRDWVSLGFARAITGTISLLGLLLALAYINREIAGAVVLVVLVFAAVAAAVSPRLRELIRESRHQRGRLANNVGEKVLVASSVQHFGQANREARRVRLLSRELRDALVRRAWLAGVIRSLPDLGRGVALAAVLIVVRGRGNSHSPGGQDLAVIILLLGMMTRALRDMAKAWESRLAFLEGERRISTLLEGAELPRRENAVQLDADEPAKLVFRRVSSGNVLACVCAQANPGERVVVVGASGSGKSTLLRLAARLLDPCEGGVELDGHPLTEVELSCLHESVQLVSPDVPFLRGSLRRNLRYSARGADAGWVEQVAGLCGILDDTTTFPDGLATRLEERGTNLSSGGRARVALARALVAKPRLLLVDDPMFFVDRSTGHILCRALAVVRTTVLIVGNTDDVPIDPDQVWRLERGRLKAQIALPTRGGAVVEPAQAQRSPTYARQR